MPVGRARDTFRASTAPPTSQRLRRTRNSPDVKESAAPSTISLRTCAEGTVRVLVLRGEAGIGKSALLEHLIAAASGCTILHATGVESEVEVPFAALQQLCAPLLDRLEPLPDPQRDAARTAFGLANGTTPDRLVIGLAVLNLLSAASGDAPVLCVVDDAHWLDRRVGPRTGLRRETPARRTRRVGVRHPVRNAGPRQDREDGGRGYSTTAMPTRCSAPCCTARSTTACASASSRRRTVTRSRSSSGPGV